MVDNETKVGRGLAQYPPADMTPREFELFVADILRAGEPGLDEFKVTSHEMIEGVDGAFDFDATVRYRFLGMDFLVVVEAKHHINPIKRELVQVLHAKVQSVGAHKGMLIATAPFQQGAVTFAKTHGIALVTVTEGRFTYETRGATPAPPMSRQQASAYGLPVFVAVHFGPGHTPDFTTTSILDLNNSTQIHGLLLDVPA